MNLWRINAMSMVIRMQVLMRSLHRYMWSCTDVL